MKTSDIHPAFRQVIGFMEAFRRLGFPTTSLGLTLSADLQLKLNLLDGYRHTLFSCNCGTFEQDDWVRRWTDLLEQLATHQISQLTLDECWNQSRAHVDHEQFLETLRRRGITPPLANLIP